MKRILYNIRSLRFSLKSSKLMFFSFDALLKGREGEGGIMIVEKKRPIFFHFSEHVDHFKAMKFFPLEKEINSFVGGYPPHPFCGKRPYFFRFFLMKAFLWYGFKKNTNSGFW